VRWRRVFDFSARNVGPKQYLYPTPPRRLHVELARLREIGLAEIKVVDGEQLAGLLPDQPVRIGVDGKPRWSKKS
jgi:hypothetical protein